MWDKGVRIYGTPGVHNNYPLKSDNYSSIYVIANPKS